MRSHAPPELTDEFGLHRSSYFTDRHKRRRSWARSPLRGHAHVQLVSNETFKTGVLNLSYVPADG
jgi:hypothetical protein